MYLLRIDGVLQRDYNGHERANYHIAQNLTEEQRHYSQLEKEVLTLIIAIERFHKILWGRKFTLQTDHILLFQIENINSLWQFHKPRRNTICIAIRWALSFSQALVGRENMSRPPRGSAISKNLRFRFAWRAKESRKAITLEAGYILILSVFNSLS